MARDPRSREGLKNPQFSGTSGTSALNAPLTSPGAESTTDLNPGRRLDPPAASEQQANVHDSSAPGELVEMPRPSCSAASPEHSRTEDEPQREMVPDVPLSEYISHFHYEPPSDSEEVKTRAEAAPEHLDAAASGYETALPAETAAIADADSQYFSLTGEALGGAEATNRARFEVRVHFHRRQDLWLAALTIAAVIGVGAIAWHARAKHASSPTPIASETRTLATVAPAPVPSTDNTPALAHQNVLSAPAGSAPAAALKEEPSSLLKASASATKPVAHANPTSPVDLANKYLKGEGVARNCDKAIALLKTAAAKANVRACNQLASMYAIGSCVQRDRVQAYHWLNAALAAEPGNEWAQHNRDLILRQMTPEERSAARANR